MCREAKEVREHAASKIKIAVSMKIPADNNKRCNIVAIRKRLRTVRGKELTKQKDFNSILSKTAV